MYAVEHIHNDLNLSNIALNEKDEPIVIDWGSSKRFGERLISGGTPDWIDESFDVSNKVKSKSQTRTANLY